MNLRNLFKLICSINRKAPKMLPTIQALSYLVGIISGIVQIGHNVGLIDRIQKHSNSTPIPPNPEQVQSHHEK